MAAQNVPPPTHNCFGSIGYEERAGGKQPAWHQPTTGLDKGLKVMNSLAADTNVPFIPSSGNRVLWYTCGPTVYDSCHMGHARAYLTFDILRRITEDYFGYDVVYHINITDVDDKIINRARENVLFERFAAATKDPKEVAAVVRRAVEREAAGLKAKEAELSEPLPENANSKVRTERKEQLMVLELKQKQFDEAKEKIDAVIETGKVEDILAAAAGPLKKLLDHEQGATVTDHSIFDAHARKYEAEFFEDMERLGVKQPDVLTRVTEYIPQIVDYIKQIVDKGLAYESNGSVYLSIDEFKKQGHTYRKLSPGDEASAAEMAEGEGALAGDGSEKRNKNDFALWKKSKAGEPVWDSPWGGGRPGWHIECSVVASDILGNVMDVHAGGQDLKFPHHDNELAQSESCYGHGQWVNYFYHAGHLSIKGLKMAKSLKNFITIRQALTQASPRVLRLLFLEQTWHKSMNYSDQALGSAKAKEKAFREFFHKVKSLERSDWAAKRVGWEAPDGQDRKLMNLLLETQAKVDAAFRDNFDTPTAIAELDKLVTAFNKYESQVPVPSVHLALKIAQYLTKIFRVLGLCESNDAYGFGTSAESKGVEGGASKEETLAPVLDSFASFRRDVRVAARSKDGDAGAKVLEACDAVRKQLPQLGVAFEDKGDEVTWKIDSPDVLLAEMREKEEAAAQAALKKVEGKKQRLEKDLAKAEKVLEEGEPAQMFKKQAEFDGFAFDDEGVPKADKEGAELAKSKLKGLKKQFDTQKKAWDALVKTSGGDPAAYVQSLRDEVAALAAQLAGQ